MNAIEFGAKQAVNNCLKIKKGEKVVIITDKQTAYLADALINEAKTAGAEIQKFVMEDFGQRPADGVGALKFPSEIATALSRAQVSFYIAAGKKGELQSFRHPMIEVIEKHKLRHGHMIGFTEEMMSQGMASDYVKIQALSKKVFDIVSKAKEIRVTTPAGTDFTVSLNPNYKWIISDGNITAEQWSNLPDGEVFTSPENANGTVVVDGCLGDFFTEKYGNLKKTPLTYTLKNGRCVKGSVSCKNQELKDEFEKYTFSTDENSNRLGEFAIGTNTGLTKLIGNLLQDEKFPGVHVALGNPYPNMTGAPWKSEAHNDAVLLNCTVRVDGRAIMENSTFKI